MRLLVITCLSLFSHTVLGALTLTPMENLILYPTYTLSAEVISRNETTISAEIAARIEQIHVRPGELVKQGQALVQLDCRDTHSQLARLQANQKETQAALDYARTQVARFRSLKSKDYASNSQVEQTEAESKRLVAVVEGMKVSIEQAERNISKCTIHAPYTGIMQHQLTGVGALASVGTALLTLIQTEQAEIRTAIPLHLLASLQQQPVTFSAAGIDSIVVRLLRQNAMIEPNTRNVMTWFQADIPLRIGLSGNITLTDALAHLPAGLIVRRGDQLGFFIREDAKAKFIHLPSAQEGRPVPLPSHLQGKRIAVISDGFQRLNDGDALP